MTSENPLWRQQRQVIQPAFHRRSLDRFETVMQEASQQVMDRLDPYAISGEPVDISAGDGSGDVGHRDPFTLLI
ncbi:MAG: hypothetical protein R3C44_12285 [Chloroflexota bacterium]